VSNGNGALVVTFTAASTVEAAGAMAAVCTGDTPGVAHPDRSTSTAHSFIIRSETRTTARVFRSGPRVSEIELHTGLQVLARDPWFDDLDACERAGGTPAERDGNVHAVLLEAFLNLRFFESQRESAPQVLTASSLLVACGAGAGDEAH
jgi:hypothetical protein